MGRTTPVFGVLSLVFPLLGSAGLVLGVQSDTGSGEVLALLCLGFAPLLGFLFAAASLFRREPHRLIPVLGFLESSAFVGYFWLRLWR